tara:strand:+ start:136 stop:597 length:462 start_codon:yes stop_codon:yes gene_type:complete
MININIEVAKNTRKHRKEAYFFRATTENGRMIGKAYFDSEEEAMAAGAALMATVCEALNKGSETETVYEYTVPKQEDAEPTEYHTMDEVLNDYQNKFEVTIIIDKDTENEEEKVRWVQADDKVEAAAKVSNQLKWMKGHGHSLTIAKIEEYGI